VSQWPAAKARRVLAALLRNGWSVKRHCGGSHRVLERIGWPDFVFAFHDDVEIGPRMLARIAKHTGLQPGDLGRALLRRAEPSNVRAPTRPFAARTS
jgi:predicted RNA binding protein YcfA (HicA-like mRNA interferase family)